MRRPLLLAALAAAVPAGALLAGQSLTIVQRDRAFSEAAVAIGRGDTLRFTNADGFPHQIYVQSPTFNFDSDPQGPGSTIEVTIPVAGRYGVLCGIHPKMRLDVEVR